MMRPLPHLVVALALVWITVGCQPQTAVSKETTGGSASTGTSATPAPTGTTATTTAGTGESTTTTNASETPKFTEAQVPAELKETDVYKYYGLGNLQPMDIEIVRSDTKTVITGSSVNKISDIKDGAVTYEIERTGGLFENLGNEVNVLKADGLHLESTSRGKLKQTGSLQFPAKLTPGTTWHVSTSIEVEGQGTVTDDSTYKVVGVQQVKTKVGTYPDALLVTSSGEWALNDRRFKSTGKQWLVSGKGLVRYEVSSTSVKDKKTTTMTVEETKPE